MKIERVQYDGEGQWLDVVFDDGKKARFAAALVRNLAEIAGWDGEASPCETSEKEEQKP